MSNPVPARIDRAAIERIIQRAAELQTQERDLSEGLAPGEVVALGKEVGIPERFLQQAMLEERTKAAPVTASTLMDKTIGVATITTQRVIRGTVAEAERRLLRWIADHELLMVQRQTPDRITWEPLGGMSAALRRSSAAIGGHRPFMLSKASLVSASVSQLEQGYVHVALTAEMSGVRAGVVGGMAAMGTIGIATATILAVLSPFWWLPLAPLPAFIGAGYAIRKGYPSAVERVRLGLERALDHLEREDPRTVNALPGGVSGLLGDVVRAITGDRPK